MRMIFLALCLVGLAVPGRAQDAPATLDLAHILGLADSPWLDRAMMLDALNATLPDFQADLVRPGASMAGGDPWFWSITGQFGTPRPDLQLPGGILACSRYGVETRDVLAGSSLSDPTSFRLLGATMAAHDDAAVWPEDAVARVSCMLTWDDTRRVSILSLPSVLEPLRGRFVRTEVTGDAEHYGAGWERYSPLYGPDGYRVEARGGDRSSASVIERVLVELRVTHQRITFRAFLLGGGA